MSDELLNNIIKRLSDHCIDEYFEYIPGNGYHNTFNIKAFIPLKNEGFVPAYVQNKRKLEQYIVDNHLLMIVDAEGGSEGEGEYVERIIGAYPIKGMNYEEFWLNIDDARFFRLNGCYQSYDGVTWDSPSDLVEVKPKIVEVIKYE